MRQVTIPFVHFVDPLQNYVVTGNSHHVFPVMCKLKCGILCDITFTKSKHYDIQTYF